MNIADFRVRPGKKVRLNRFSTDHTRGVKGKADALRQSQKNIAELATQQERLAAQNQWALLVIFQAMDAAGKDSTIKHVLTGVNPQGVHVTSFKAPSTLQLDHDYLWRSAVALPERGVIGIHNRSHYEELLIVKVHPELLDHQHLPDEIRRGSIWKQRYRQINDFERHLVENGTVVLKFFLHVSKDQQRKRFLDRIEEASKHWKFSLQDVKERAHWDDYRRAYEDLLEETSTARAPWYVIPADHKWYMQLAVGHIIVHTLRGMKLDLPALTQARRQELIEAKMLLDAGA
jgi:PPK2 family polyphosphate:nucleotide phosphotransferase